LTQQQIADFHRDGHIVLRGIAPDLLDYKEHFLLAKKKAENNFYKYALKEMSCEHLITDQISENTLEKCRNLNKTHPPIIPYVQYINLHRLEEKVNGFVLSKKFASIAAKLLQVSSLILYQSTAFFKPPSPSLLNQETGWHRDLNLVPIDTNNYLTMWCPLLKIKQENSILEFATSSHRDIAFLHWFPDADKGDLKKVVNERYTIVDYGSYEIGDCSFHHGWTFHHAKKIQQITKEKLLP